MKRTVCRALWDSLVTAFALPGLQTGGGKRMMGIAREGIEKASHSRILQSRRWRDWGGLSILSHSRGFTTITSRATITNSTVLNRASSTIFRKGQFFAQHAPPQKSRYILSRGFGTGFIAWESVPGCSSTGAAAATTGGHASAPPPPPPPPPPPRPPDPGLHRGLGCSKCGWEGLAFEKGQVGKLASAGWRKNMAGMRKGKPHAAVAAWGRVAVGPGVKRMRISSSAGGNSGTGSGRNSGGLAIGGGSIAGGNGSSGSGGIPGDGRGNGKNGGDGKGSGNGKDNTTAITRNQTSSQSKSPAPEFTSHEPGILGRIAQIHRPTKDEMLAAANSMFARLRIRTKWALIRQMRPYNLEEISAFLQWLLVGHIIWVVVGTTTFFSIVLLLVNTVYAQENFASLIGNYLTKETGIRVVFESAIVPRWKDGRISFKNVFASRRPGNLKDKTKKNVQKGSSVTAAAAAAAAAHAEDPTKATPPTDEDEEEDTNYTQFDVTIDEVAVTLSFAKWMNGRGLLKDVEVKGVRGVVDRTHVHWPEGVDPRSYKHVHQPGDFEIDSFKLEDLLVTVYQPDGFRPFSISIYNCDLPQLRKQYLFYDFLSANNMSGSYDDSLFTIHPRQSHGISPSQQLLLAEGNGTRGGSAVAWKKMSRLRIDALKIDHLNRGVEGPFGWIERGNVDMVVDIMFPEDNDDGSFGKVVQEIVGRVEKTVTSSTNAPYTSPFENIPNPFSTKSSQPQVLRPPPSSSSWIKKDKDGCDNRYVVTDFHMQLNDVKATVPLFTKELSYVNSALIRPIVAYINSRKTYIPIHCRVIKKASEFDGSWTVYDSGLMDDISAEMYEAFAKQVTDREARRRRFRKVGLWSLQLLAQALLMAMAGNLA